MREFYVGDVLTPFEGSDRYFIIVGIEKYHDMIWTREIGTREYFGSTKKNINIYFQDYLSPDFIVSPWIDNLENYMRETFAPWVETYQTRLPILCADGFSFSVQGSRGHHSVPKADVDLYENYEVGYPSEKEPLLDDFSSNSDDIFIHVNRDTIEKIISKHGGFKRP